MYSMLSKWTHLLNTDCKVISIGDSYIYPIFRNGSSSLCHSQDNVYYNNEIRKCRNIKILIRDPEVRFVSGINQYSQFNKMSVMDTWRMVNEGKLFDRHFMPQAMWLLHLYRFYNGTVTMQPFSRINQFTSEHNNEFLGVKTKVPLLPNFIDVDHQLLDMINQELELGAIIAKVKHALS